MQITINEKTYTVEKVPMMARRKFMEVRVAEEKEIEEYGTIRPHKHIEFENEMLNILVFSFEKQFTAEDLLKNITEEYFNEKLAEVVFGKSEENEDDEGN